MSTQHLITPPPELVQQALAALEQVEADFNTGSFGDIIRRALEACQMTDQLRARVEALEELHKAVVDLNERFSLDPLVARVELLEATQHAHIDTSRLSDEERDQICQDLARPARVFATAEVAPIVAPTVKDSLTDPAGSLLDRMTWLIAKQFTESSPGTDCAPFGRAVILEVAAWLVEQAPEPGPVGKWLEQISTPFAVMADMLRDEANR